MLNSFMFDPELECKSFKRMGHFKFVYLKPEKGQNSPKI